MKPATPRPAAILSTLLVALFANGCAKDATDVATEVETGASQAATVRVLLKDAPADYIAAASVDIGAVELVSAGGTHVRLADDGTEGFVNLLDLQGAATEPIAEAAIDPGSFVQLRLIVDAARVTLKDGYTFRDGTTEKDLKIPSGMQTGIKLNLKDAADGGPLQIIPGETVIVLDFNVDKSFVLLGNFETPAGVHGVNFKPTIQVTGQNVAATVSGTVSTLLEGESVEGLTVRAEPSDGGTVPGYTPQSATSTTDADGNYTIPFLVPGSYDVTVDVSPGRATDPESQAVTLAYGENRTGVDFEVIDVTGSIAGTVSTALAGVSVEGLTVTATPQTEGMDALTATTASDGAFTVDEVVPGSYVVTVEVAEGQVTDPIWAVVDVGISEDVTGVDFAIVQSGSIAGTVSTTLEGVSVEGLTVTASAEGQPDVATATASDGTYSFAALPAGTWTITLTVGDGYTTDPASLDVDLAAGDAAAGADFEVIASGG